MKELSWYYYWYYRGQDVSGMPSWIEANKSDRLPEPVRLTSALDDEADTLTGSEQQVVKEEA